MTTIQEAKEILGENNVFGPDEWKKYFRDYFKVPVIPEIPWDMEKLKKPGIDQEHFLFLGLDSLNGQLLLTPNINYSPQWWDTNDKQHDLWQGISWRERMGEKDSFAKHPCELGWYLMPVGLVKGSTNLNKMKQIDLLRDQWFGYLYEIPTALEYILANALYRILNGKWMCIGGYGARTTKWNKYFGRGFPLLMVCFNDNNRISINSSEDDAYQMVGIAASLLSHVRYFPQLGRFPSG